MIDIENYSRGASASASPSNYKWWNWHHSTDQRSEQLAALGAEVVVGDLREIEIVRRAMLGIAPRLLRVSAR
jgi:hypothetical protein